jgi:hypothetical protein
VKSLYGLVGMKHRGTEALVASLPNGEPLLLVREPDNKFDRFAVQVWARGQHVGFIKGAQVKPLAIAMDAAPVVSAAAPIGKRAKLAIDGGKWPLVEVEE